MENHEATQHEFARRCLRYFYDEADLDEREQLEEDLPVFAEGVYHFGGYDLDQRLAALTAENERLRAGLQQIADGNPAPPGGTWLSDAKMAQIARGILSTVEAAS